MTMSQKTISRFTLFITTVVFAGMLGVTTSAYENPTASAPGNNTDGPINIGPTNQVKDGSLGVNAFVARNNALFNDKVRIDGLVRGGVPANVTSTVTVGSTTEAVGMKTVGTLHTELGFKVGALAHGGSDLKPICADADGILHICGKGLPSLIETSNTLNNSQNLRTQTFKVGKSVAAGNKYHLRFYSDSTYVVAVAGDTPETIAIKLRDAINNTAVREWNAGGVPNFGSPGFPPKALADRDEVIITFNFNREKKFTSEATEN